MQVKSSRTRVSNKERAQKVSPEFVCLWLVFEAFEDHFCSCLLVLDPDPNRRPQYIIQHIFPTLL